MEEGKGVRENKKGWIIAFWNWLFGTGWSFSIEWDWVLYLWRLWCMVSWCFLERFHIWSRS